MASSPVILNNGLSLTQENSRLQVRETRFLRSHKGLSCSFSNSSCSSPTFPLFSFQNSCYIVSQRRLLCCSNVSCSLIDQNRDKATHLGNSGNGPIRKRFSLRLRPRLRLLSRRFKGVLIRSMLDNVGTYLRKNIRKVLSVSLTVVLGLCLLVQQAIQISSPKVVPYSDLIANLQNGSVMKVLFEEGRGWIYYNTNKDTENLGDRTSSGLQVFKKLMGTSTPQWQYSTRKIDHDVSFLLSLMREKGTVYSSAPQSVFNSIRSIFLTVLMLWIPLTPLMWLLYRQLSAANSPGKKRQPSAQVVNFGDVEGVDGAKVELMEIVLCLQGDIDYNRLGAKLPTGVLLVGPPGTGKTLLARAVAGEAGVPFFTVAASEFVEMYVGRGAARIRDLFKVARENAPSIIFIDELDAVGGRRGRSFNDERDQTLNQLLTEMDGFESDMNVVVIAATNRPEALDPALCRAGRFSRKVYVGEPDEDGRKKILAVHMRGIPVKEDVGMICDLVASVTPGFVGADLANIVNEAALLAARRGGECVSMCDILQAINRAKFGINEKQQSGRISLSKELGKLFPWMPSLMGKIDPKWEGPEGYQTLS